MCTRTQEKEAVTSQETESDLPVNVLESLGEAWVDSGFCGVRGTDYSSPGSRAVLAYVLLKEVTIAVITPTIVWPQKNYRDLRLPHPLAEIWIIDLQSIASPTRARPSYLHSQSLPAGSFQSLLS